MGSSREGVAQGRSSSRGNEDNCSPGAQIQPKQDTTGDDKKHGEKVEQ
jgi:hypothetical protein